MDVCVIEGIIGLGARRCSARFARLPFAVVCIRTRRAAGATPPAVRDPHHHDEDPMMAASGVVSQGTQFYSDASFRNAYLVAAALTAAGLAVTLAIPRILKPSEIRSGGL